jgi:Flp pilus assembly protein TadD
MPTEDPNATTAILRGDLNTAERVLLSEQKFAPDRPEVMINLTTVYRLAGVMT